MSEILSQIYIGFHVKYRYSCQILYHLDFQDRFSKNLHISNFIIFSPVGAELFHEDKQEEGQTDRQTDMAKLTVVFSNFVNVPKNNMVTLLI